MTREAVRRPLRAERTRERAMVPKLESQSYYGQPVIKPPVWHPSIPFYFFTGGLGGASAAMGLAAGLRGNHVLARRAWTVAMAGAGVSPMLLISDLGKPARFLNMLRMFKVTSPMSVGSWILVVSGSSTSLAAAHELTGLFPRAGRAAKLVAGTAGLPLATYTAGLLSNTAVPAWHGARLVLPFMFAGSSAASAGAAAVMTTPAKHAGPARRLAVGGAAVSVGSALAMERILGDAGEPYSKGLSGVLTRASGALIAIGAGAIAARAARSRRAALAGGAILSAGVIAGRWSVFRAGFASARDPKYTVKPQRSRIERGESRGAVRRAG